MKDLLERLREGIRAQAITAAILAILATTAARVDAFDFVLPIPKPSLPSIPLPKFFDEPTRTLSDDDLETIKRAGSVDRGEHARLAEERATPPQDALAPRYSDRLPYCVILGMVVCESNFPLDEIGGLQAEITQLQLDLVGYLNIPKSTEPIELCLFRDTQSYTDFIRAVFPGAPLDRPALYVKDSGPGVLMVQRDGNMIVNIRHEMTHAYLNASLKHVPIWIDEGLAKYFETPPGERGFRNPYLKDVEAKASGLFSSPPSLSRLEKLTRVDQMRSREYREAWSWVHFMIHYSHDTHVVLANYLRSLRPEEQADVTRQDAYKRQKKAPLKQALERYVPDYEKKYVEHFRNWDSGKEKYETARDD
ncbi:MAG: DUF1570 domain-containing protein [Thermoguttaceae bacterium]|nr:DUF1570 domain-containing protein [Thermoguttaceae bacterium]